MFGKTLFDLTGYWFGGSEFRAHPLFLDDFSGRQGLFGLLAVRS